MVFRFSGKIPVALGIGATAARHALDVEIGVRIPDPQLEEGPPFRRIFLFLLMMNIIESWVDKNGILEGLRYF